MKIEFSPWKWYKGFNLEPFTYRDLITATEMIQDKISFPLNRFTAKELKIAVNMQTENPPFIYYKNFGELMLFSECKPYHRSNIEEESLYYKRAARHLKFYDKIAHVKSEKQSIPEQYKKQHWLRMELSLQTVAKIKEKIGYDITWERFRSPEFFIQAGELLLNFYRSIHKQGFLFNVERLKNIDDINRDDLLHIAYPLLERSIYIAQKCKNISKKEAFNYRNNIALFDTDTSNRFLVEL